MAKLTLNDHSSGYQSAAAHNSNNDQIEAEFQDKVLYRDNPVGEPNTMEQDLDMNSNQIKNLDAPVNNNDAARLQDITDASSIGTSTGVLTSITDSGGYYTSDNSEGALQELGPLVAVTPELAATTAYAATILDDANASTARDTLGIPAVIDAAVNRKNYIINPTFAVNQRVFGGGALADTVYGYDRWKANGVSTSLALSGIVLTITGTALEQVIEDFDYTGDVTVSWVGTSTVQGVNTSPYTYTKSAGNDTLTFEPGTLSEVKFEIGDTATPFEYPDIGTELSKCERYYIELTITLVTASNWGNSHTYPTTMRASPTLTLTPDSGTGGTVAGTAHRFTQSATHSSTQSGLVEADAEL